MGSALGITVLRSDARSGRVRKQRDFRRDIYYRQKNYEKAVEQLSLAVKANPKDYKAQYTLGSRWPNCSAGAKRRSISPRRALRSRKVSRGGPATGALLAANHNQGIAT